MNFKHMINNGKHNNEFVYISFTTSSVRLCKEKNALNEFQILYNEVRERVVHPSWNCGNNLLGHVKEVVVQSWIEP